MTDVRKTVENVQRSLFGFGIKVRSFDLRAQRVDNRAPDETLAVQSADLHGFKNAMEDAPRDAVASAKNFQVFFELFNPAEHFSRVRIHSNLSLSCLEADKVDAPAATAKVGRSGGPAQADDACALTIGAP